MRIPNPKFEYTNYRVSGKDIPTIATRDVQAMEVYEDYGRPPMYSSTSDMPAHMSPPLARRWAVHTNMSGDNKQADDVDASEAASMREEGDTSAKANHLHVDSTTGLYQQYPYPPSDPLANPYRTFDFNPNVNEEFVNVELGDDQGHKSRSEVEAKRVKDRSVVQMACFQKMMSLVTVLYMTAWLIALLTLLVVTVTWERGTPLKPRLSDHQYQDACGEAPC